METTSEMIERLLAMAEALDKEARAFRGSISLGTRQEWEAYEMMTSAVARLRGAAACLSELQAVTR